MSEIYLPPVTTHRVVDQLAAAGIVPWWRTEFGLAEDQPRGAGIRVGVVDTGIDQVHVQSGSLVNSVKSTRDFSNSPSGAKDAAGHGTHVAGIIAGRGSLWGVAPECELVIAKALGDDGTGRAVAVANGIKWAVDEGCQVINCSLGSPIRDNSIEQSLDYAARHGVLVFGASGNEGASTVSSPAGSDKCLGVGACDRNRGLAPFSNRGSEVDCVGPGVKILSAFKGGKFAEMSGTSMATPWVVGLFACYLSLRKAHGWSIPRTVAEATAVLEATCDDLGTAGRDVMFGWGLPVPRRLFEPPAVAPVPIPGGPFPSMVVTVMYGDLFGHGSLDVKQVEPGKALEAAS